MPAKTRSRFGKRFTAQKREHIWISSMLQHQSVTDAPVILPLVEPDEWRRGDPALLSFQRGATLLAIRGWLDVGPATSAAITTNGALFMFIIKQDTEDPLANPATIAEYAEEDVLWTAGMQVIQSTTAPLLRDAGPYFDINVKAKRKLDSQVGINLMLASSIATADFRVSGLVRALVQLP